jgi:hypothetical protein
VRAPRTFAIQELVLLALLALLLHELLRLLAQLPEDQQRVRCARHCVRCMRRLQDQAEDRCSGLLLACLLQLLATA